MANIPPVELPSPDWMVLRGTHVYQWANITTADTPLPLDLGSHSDRSFQVSGTLSGATVKAAGTNDAAVPYAPVQDGADNDIAVSSYPSGFSSRIEIIAPATRYLKPVIVGGDGSTSVTVTLYVRRNA
jgi:hypothetical protein